MSESSGKELARVGSYGRSTLNERQQYALALSKAGELVPKNFWTRPTPNPAGGMFPAVPNPGAILYMLETAAMVGVNPMVGLTNIHIIEGKPSLSANLQAALVREAGHRLRVWMSEDGKTATCEIVRSDDPDFPFRVSWGDAEMNAAQLASKDNWKKYQRSMKKARAITECIREACPEVLMGATYSPDELGAVTDEMGEPIDLPQVPEPSQTGTPAPADVPRETAPEPAAEKPAEKPVEDAPPKIEDGGGVDWNKEIRAAKTSERIRELYREARQLGLLESTVKVGRKNRLLGEALMEIGKSFADLEAAAAAGGPEGDAASDVLHQQPDDTAVDAADPDTGEVVEAEIVDEPDYNEG